MRLWTIGLLFFSVVAQAADVPAVLVNAGRVEIGPRVSGIVKSVHANVGDRVKKGQILLVLDNSIYQAKTSASAAIVARRELEMSDAKLNLTRVQELYDRTVSSTSELDEVKLKEGRADSSLKEARAELAIHSKNVSDTVVRAPLDAVVVSRLAEPGQNVVVTVGPQAVFILARSNSMLARGNLSVTQAKGLNIGRPLDVVVNNRVYAGKIANIVYEPNKDSVLVEAAFSAGEAFPSGMPATLRVP